MTGDEPTLFRNGVPRIISGVEHEYKWLIVGDALPEFADGVDAVLARVGTPLGYRRSPVDTSTLSSVYFDTPQWTLQAAGVSLAVILNYGARRNNRWLLLKNTLLWAQGRRDTLKIGERLDPGPVSHVLSAWTAQPLLWLERTFGQRLDLRPYGAFTQRRRQALITSASGISLGLSLDEATTRDVHGTDLTTDRWFEVEANQPDFAGLAALADWAEMISDRLDARPYGTSKPSLLADRVGARRAA